MKIPGKLTVLYYCSLISISGCNYFFDKFETAGDKIINTTIDELNIHITEGPITLPDAGQMIFIRDQNPNVMEFHQNG